MAVAAASREDKFFFCHLLGSEAEPIQNKPSSNFTVKIIVSLFVAKFLSVWARKIDEGGSAITIIHYLSQAMRLCQ